MIVDEKRIVMTMMTDDGHEDYNLASVVASSIGRLAAGFAFW